MSVNRTILTSTNALLAVGLTAVFCFCGCSGTSRGVSWGQATTARDPVSGRAYGLYVPSHYHTGQNWPLVITCHDDEPAETPDREVREWRNLAERESFILAAPDLRRKSVLKLGSDNRTAEERTAEDEAFILSIIRTIRGAYAIDDMRIFFTGRGSGAFTALRVGLRHPDLCRAISVRQPWFKVEMLDPSVPFLDPYQPIQVLYCVSDVFGKKAAEACISWLQDHEMNVITLTEPGVRRRDPRAMFTFVSDVVRRQPLIRIQVRDNSADAMSVGFAARMSFTPTKVRWDFGDGQNADEPAPSHKYEKAGKYTVKLAVWSSGKQPQVRQVEVRIPRVRLGGRQ
jgi:hypothetical protein